METLRKESPTTRSWFDVTHVLEREGPDWDEFRSSIAGQVGIPLEKTRADRCPGGSLGKCQNNPTSRRCVTQTQLCPLTLADRRPAVLRRDRPLVAACALTRLRALPDRGGGGIRTHGTVAGTPAFRAGQFSHSCTPPVLAEPGNAIPPKGKPAAPSCQVPAGWRAPRRRTSCANARPRPQDCRR